MADEKQYLDDKGLEHYHEKLKSVLDKKVNTDGDKVLSEQDFTTTLKNKLESLENYTLPAASSENLGGVKIEATESNSYGSTALKVDDTGKAFVDWSEAPKATTYQAGLIKLGTGLKTGEDGSAEVDSSNIKAGSVDWSNIDGKPELVTRDEIGKVYKYKGTVDTYSELPTGLSEENIGDVYNVKDTGVNYAYAGIGEENADEKGWDSLGGIFTISAISDEMIDSLFE